MKLADLDAESYIEELITFPRILLKWPNNAVGPALLMEEIIPSSSRR
jgi:hypothetical protein